MGLKINKIKRLFGRRYKIETCSPQDKYCVSGSVGILVAIFLVFFMVVTIVYAVYSVMRVTGMSNLAGVHITTSLKVAAQEVITGKRGIPSGYDGWQSYKSDAYELKYPADWKIKENGSLWIRKFNATSIRGMESLADAVNVGEIGNPGNVSLEEIMKKNGMKLDEGAEDAEIAGKMAKRTTHVAEDGQEYTDSIYWNVDGKVYYIVVSHYNKARDEDDGEVEKIVKSFKFLD